MWPELQAETAKHAVSLPDSGIVPKTCLLLIRGGYFRGLPFFFFGSIHTRALDISFNSIAGEHFGIFLGRPLPFLGVDSPGFTVGMAQDNARSPGITPEVTRGSIKL
jgi:hypothetical protein